jgi:hypothetical protein
MRNFRFLLLVALVALSTTHVTAAVLLDTVDGGQFFETRAGGNAILTFLQVGGADVNIGAFGPYGQMLADGNARWIIFDASDVGTPAFLSAPVALSAAAEPQFYDIHSLSFDLLANHSYYLGMIADVPFSYGWEYPGYSAVATSETANGLTAPVGPNGNESGFDSPAWVGQGAVQQSIRIDDAAVPEPATMILLALGLGAIVVRRIWASNVA